MGKNGRDRRDDRRGGKIKRAEEITEDAERHGKQR